MIDVQSTKSRLLYRAQKRFLWTVTGIILAVIFVVFLANYLFVVRKIEFVSESPFYTEEQILEASGLSLGDKMFSFSAEDVRADMLRKLSYFADVRVTKVFPSTVEISFEEISGTMYVDVIGSHYILSPEFRVIARAGEEALEHTRRMHVICTSVDRCVVGEEISMTDTEQLALLQEIYRCLDKNGAVDQITYLDATDRFHISLNVNGKWDVALGDSSELDYKIRMLIKVVEKAHLDYGADATGSIDVTGVTEAITKIYAESE